MRSFVRPCIFVALLGLVGLAPATSSASTIVDFTYVETPLSGGQYQYDYTLLNGSDPVLDAGFNVYDVFLTFATGNVVSVAVPSGWDSFFGSGFAELFSLSTASDVVPGASLGGFQLVFDQRMGPLTFEALFSNPSDESNPISVPGETSGTASPVPEPGSIVLLGAGVLGIAASRVRRQRQRVSTLPETARTP